MARAPKPRSNPALRFAAVRRIHTYLGLLIAPSVLLFALTGALQIYKLHEAHEAYVPPPVIEKLGMVHKVQVYRAHGKRPGPPAAEGARPAAPTAAKPPEAKPPEAKTPAKPKLAVTLLKAFFLLVSIALAAATVLGAWMALAYGREKTLSWILLGAGTVIPAVLIILSAP
ncbi:hypothetical protein [Caulobacter segnis]|uniref:PepSY domain-containing protein n=1 Tax=Caulobacter segnis TaxID=88688 RepID=A0A2W5V0J2_9CAUL|nr:hypothetical protein [Caulobacter segnis]PZR31393.1 MAG: hypothetical protein DI526_19800 [Caulobacter segnis]